MIKSILKTAVASLILTTTLQAEEKAVTMRTILDGMNLIQLGFLTNTEILIEEGVFEVNHGKSILEAIGKTKNLSFEEIQYPKYIKQITIHTDLLLKEYKSGEIKKAMLEYKSLMNTCISCHMRLRDYKDRGFKFK